VAGVAPEIVASITSVGGNNTGSAWMESLTGGGSSGNSGIGFLGSIVSPVFKLLAYPIINVAGKGINILSGKPNDPIDPAGSLFDNTLTGAEEFNKRFPAGVPVSCDANAAELGDNGVYYYSWTGVTPVTGSVWDAVLGPLMPLFKGEPNDGLTTVCSSRLGVQLGELKQNHLDETNVLGLAGVLSVPAASVFAQHVTFLSSKGL
jgi:triacylglycerol lipase